MSSNARRTVLFPEPESPVRITSWRPAAWRVRSLGAERFFTIAKAYLAFDPALVGAGDAHILAIFGDRAPRHLDAGFIQFLRDLVVGQRLRRRLFIDHFLYQPLQCQQRHVAALGAVHRFA